MRIAILGGGKVGSVLAQAWTRAGHDVRVSTRETLRETAEHGELVVLAVPAAAIADVVDATAAALGGKTLVDATNDLRPERETGALQLAARLPAVHVVKAFNTVFAPLYERVAEAETPPAMVFCGDDDAARSVTAQLIVDAGFEPVDAGSLDRAPEVEAFARLVIGLAYGQGRGPFLYRFADR